MTRNCPICGAPFQLTPITLSRVYCSRRCKVEARRRRVCKPGPPRYSKAEIEFLEKNYKAIGAVACAAMLRRGLYGVRTKAKLLGLRERYWSHEDIKYVRDHYATDGAKAVGAVLRRRPHNVMAVARAHNIPNAPRKKVPQPTPRARAIIARVASEHGCTPYDILSSAMRRRICRARRQVAHELRAIGYSTTKIGNCLGMDHSSVCQALKRNPIAPAGISSAQMLAAQAGKEVRHGTSASERIPSSDSTLVFGGLAVSDPRSQPELEAAE